MTEWKTMRTVRWQVLTLVAAGVLAAGCSQPTDGKVTHEPAAAPAPPTIAITVAPVTTRPTRRVLEFVGTLFGNEEMTLSSQVEGQVKSIHVDLGDAVRADQVLIEIEDDNLRARLREIEATLAKSRADEARGRELVGAKVISAQEYEAMQTSVKVHEAQRDTQRVLLTHTRVVSPLSGSVARRLVSVGEYVRPGTPLVELVEDNPLKLRGDIPERFTQEIAVGQTVDIAVDAYPERVFHGRLERISPSANAENRSITVEAEVDNALRELKPGFFANAGIVTRANDDALVVPETAIVSFAGVTKLFVVHDGIAEERRVQTGTRDDQGLIEVLEGITAGEVVATSGLAKIENGAAVSVRSSDS